MTYVNFGSIIYIENILLFCMFSYQGRVLTYMLLFIIVYEYMSECQWFEFLIIEKILFQEILTTIKLIFKSSRYLSLIIEQKLSTVHKALFRNIFIYHSWHIPSLNKHIFLFQSPRITEL